MKPKIIHLSFIWTLFAIVLSNEPKRILTEQKSAEQQPTNSESTHIDIQKDTKETENQAPKTPAPTSQKQNFYIQSQTHVHKVSEVDIPIIFPECYYSYRIIHFNLIHYNSEYFHLAKSVGGTPYATIRIEYLESEDDREHRKKRQANADLLEKDLFVPWTEVKTEQDYVIDQAAYSESVFRPVHEDSLKPYDNLRKHLDVLLPTVELLIKLTNAGWSVGETDPGTLVLQKGKAGKLLVFLGDTSRLRKLGSQIQVFSLNEAKYKEPDVLTGKTTVYTAQSNAYFFGALMYRNLRKEDINNELTKEKMIESAQNGQHPVNHLLNKELVFVVSELLKPDPEQRMTLEEALGFINTALVFGLGTPVESGLTFSNDKSFTFPEIDKFINSYEGMADQKWRGRKNDGYHISSEMKHTLTIVGGVLLFLLAAFGVFLFVRANMNDKKEEEQVEKPLEAQNDTALA